MTDRQLRDEVVTLVLAGHETTALVLFYTFYLLAQSPESADRLAAELHDVVGDRDGGRAPIGHDRAAISPRDRAGSDSRALAFDYTSAPTPDPHAAQGK